LLIQAYKVFKKVGLSSKRLLIPYYWLPYTFGFGRALPAVSVNLELTFRCNLRCQMCSLVISNAVETGGFPMNRGTAEDDPKALRGEELKLSEYIDLLDQMKRFGVKKVNITGGEPLVKQDATKIVRHAKKNGFWLSMISNGTVMTVEVCDALVGAGLNSLTISLDGPQEIHNEVRGSSTGFQRLKKNVMKLQEWKKRVGSELPRIQFSCAASSLNQEHLSEIVDVAEEVGIDHVNYGYLFFSDEDVIAATDKFTLTGQSDYADQRIPMHLRKVDLEVMKREFREARRKAAEKGIKVEFNPPLEESELEARYNDKMYFYTNKCFLPWYETRVNPFGDIYSCQIDTRLGNIREKSFREIWNDEPYREFRSLIKEHALLPKCSRCCKLNDRTWNYLPRISFGRRRKPKTPQPAAPPGLVQIGTPRNSSR
jgi:MoaA/NifB/PqqE/SkfB family radical SAM enzyme